jgi:hypothetical protein
MVKYHEFIASDEDPNVCELCPRWLGDHYSDVIGVWDEDELVSSDPFDTSRYVASDW